ncbi:MAG: sulfatase [Planctomycetota bacterium]
MLQLKRLSLFLLAVLLASSITRSEERPNILWLFAEDTSPWMGCYGDPVNKGKTPNIDSLANRGVMFSRAYVPAPVCSACRSALMGGQSQIRFNAHEHRSSRGPAKLYLPKDFKLLPQLMKDAGYYTFNCGKTDYNFIWDQAATYDLLNKSRTQVPWEDLTKQQPFFGQIQTAGGKNNTVKFPKERCADPNEVTVPPDYPQNEIYKRTVAQHYDAIRKDDDFIGDVLKQLEENGLSDNTIVVYFGDHGANNLVRHKQMPTEGGLHVPFIIAGPDPWVPAPSVRDDLVNLLDLSATTLAWGKVEIPSWYEGQDLFGFKVVPRPYVAAAKDRLDHTIDRVRTVRSDRFRYTRNYKLDRIFLQPQYRDNRDFLVNLRELYAFGELSPKLTEIYFGERPAEELYDVKKDPSQLHNLAKDPEYAKVLELHREYLKQWLAKGDSGAGEESDAEIRYQGQDHKWGRAVNPEYEVVREDSDGDGLSDDWEKINGRDPDDGKLLFTFDCGGWQTEGWEAVAGKTGNIAGRQGFLDFALQSESLTLQRGELKLVAAKNQGAAEITLRCNKPISLAFAANGKAMPATKVAAEKDFQVVQIPLDQNWTGVIQRIELRFEGEKETWIEIDSIRIR